jgi:hypothetical protein
VVFGAAYWQASDQKLFTCYALLAMAGALTVAYHFTPNGRVLRAILRHAVLTICDEFIFLPYGDRKYIPHSFTQELSNQSGDLQGFFDRSELAGLINDFELRTGNL